MTNGTLRRPIPTLEPDDAFVDRLAELAAASRPTRGGVVVPVAFGGPASRAVAIAATVAAVTAGAAAAATHLSHAQHDQPAPPATSIGIQVPDKSTSDRQQVRTNGANHQQAADTTRQADGPTHSETGTGDTPTSDNAATPVHHGPSTSSGSDDPGDDHGTDSGNQGHHPGDDSGDDSGDGSGDGDETGSNQGSQDTGGGDDTGDDGGSGGNDGSTASGDDGGSSGSDRSSQGDG